MKIENRALRLARSFASSRKNHRAVIITVKASSFQNGSQIDFVSMTIRRYSADRFFKPLGSYVRVFIVCNDYYTSKTH